MTNQTEAVAIGLPFKGTQEFNWDAKTRIMTETDSYSTVYPQLLEFADQQFDKQFWTNTEMKVELDRMQLLFDLTPAQLHAVKFVLQLFLKYELIVGEEFWGNLFIKVFPTPEAKAMAAAFAAFELQVHARFYNQLNVQLGIDKDEDYRAYAANPELAKRVEWLESVLSGKDKLLSVIVFSMTETALLFASFAILKSFQTNGYNKIAVTVRGTNQSAIDEDLHGFAAAWAVNQHYKELGRPLKEDTKRVEQIYKAIQYAYEHECLIIDLAFLEDTLNGMTKDDFKNYIKVRLNVFATRLGLDEPFPGAESPITKWFDLGTDSYKMVDFFTPGMGMEYESGWDESGFIRGYVEEGNVE
ncbi:putative ribonucleotide-diphosphate reductase beta subunit [Pseudomonas phage PPSC2]|uniref:ribonucleoside-diphosphate reductase n=1 Tax=Pseudomonas phage PPSC2 TaxID=2041350 RepID=A0A2R2YAN4_9CAUD|nr:putative ribonucleotide-diphosphate reductase beta subunit [Pseudomonas phage PPSC2]ATN92828.1 putative ribonucleotide-diphosphate reductase beta subunit [Pseudomonas phage PPSC2]